MLQPIDYEVLVLGTILQNATPTGNIIAKQIITELKPAKFSTKEHKEIYRAMCDVVRSGEFATTANVVTALGDKITEVGDEGYIISLVGLVDHFKLPEAHQNWKTWVKIVDANGRIDALIPVLETAGIRLKNELNSLLYNFGEEDNLQVFIGNLLRDIQESGTFGKKSRYTHVSDLRAGEMERLKLAKQGIRIDCLNVGWSSLLKFGIPRLGVLHIIAGLTGGSKTTWTLQMALGVALGLYQNNESGHVCLNALEDSKELMYRRMAGILAGLNATNVKTGNLTDVELTRYFSALDMVDLLPFWIDDDKTAKLDDYITEARFLSAQNPGNPRVLGVWDYPELFCDTDKNESQRMTKIARKIHAFAGEINSSEFALSQYPDLGRDNPEQIGGLQTKEARSVAQHAKFVGEIYNRKSLVLNSKKFPNFKREHQPKPSWMRDDRAFLLVHKNSDGEEGVMIMNYDLSTLAFTDIADGEFIPFNFGAGGYATS